MEATEYTASSFKKQNGTENSCRIAGGKETIFKKRRKNFYDRGQKKFTGLKALNIRYTLMDCYLVDIHWPSEAFGGDRI